MLKDVFFKLTSSILLVTPSRSSSLSIEAGSNLISVKMTSLFMKTVSWPIDGCVIVINNKLIRLGFDFHNPLFKLVAASLYGL